MTLKLILAAVAALASAACTPAPAIDAASTTADSVGVLAFIGATVIPLTEPDRVLEDHTVIVHGDRIAAVGPSRSLRIPPHARRMDARGKWLIPGLVDMHVHLDHASAELDLPLYLANGVTTIRNLRGGPEHLAMRQRISRGELTGPTLYTTGPFVDRITSAADAERLVAEHAAAGYDFIKVRNHALPADRWVELTSAASRRGMQVVGHVPRDVPVATAAAGQRTLEHAEDLMQTFFRMQLDTTRIPELTAALRGSRACVVPTLVVFQYVVEQTEQFPLLEELLARPELVYVRQDLRDRWQPERNSYVTRWRGSEARVSEAAGAFRQQFEFMRAIARGLHDGGVPLAAGSDAGVAFTLPGFSLVEELELLQGVGLSAHDVLQAATRTAAECMDRGDGFGSIAPGVRADMVLLDRDPLADVAAAVSDPAAVVVRGRLLPREELRRMMDTALRRAP